MFRIFWQTIKDRKISLIVYCIAVVLMVWMYVAMFPSIQEQAESMNQLMESYPEGLLKAFGIEELVFDTVERFLSMEQFSFVWPIMVMFLMISLAGVSLAGEVEKGTIEILLSRPVSRIKIFFARYLAGIFTLAVFTACSAFAAIPLAKLHGIDYAAENYFMVAIICFLFGWAIFSIAMMLSAIFSERSKVYMLTGGLLILMYVLNIIAALKEGLADLKYISFFYYYDYVEALVRNNIELLPVVVFCAVAVVCTAIGVFWFNKRDVAI